MPRKADRGLDERILKAAQRLWRARGGKGLTLRAVAREARTTTTTVYKRFRNKEKIQVALAEMVRSRLAEVLTQSSSIEEAYRRYLRFAQNHPREYKLLYGPVWVEVIGKAPMRPTKDWIQNQLAARFGGGSGDYERVFYAIFLLVHGAASLIAAAPTTRETKETEENCIAICDLLLGNMGIFVTKPRKRRGNDDTGYRPQARGHRETAGGLPKRQNFQLSHLHTMSPEDASWSLI